MNPAAQLLDLITKAAEGNRREGFTVGGVTITVDLTTDRVSFTGVIPVAINTNASGEMVITARDFLQFQAPAPAPAPAP